jgi:type I restriction enzyme S subunit
LSDLPEGWEEARLDEIANVALGKMLDRAKQVRGRSLPYLRNINVRWDNFDLSNLLEMMFKEDELERFALRPGDLMICEGGEPGRAAVWLGNSGEIKYQKALLRARVNGASDPRWVMHSLRKDALGGDLEAYFTGSTIKHFPLVAAKSYRLAVPPLAEQLRIIEKVEILLADVNVARERLANVPTILRRFRQSVLAAACSGRLTEDWRETHLELPSPTGVETEPDPPTELPERWRCLTTESLCDPTRALTYGVIKLGPPVADGVPTLRSSDVRPLWIDETAVKRISPAIEAQYERTRLRGGEVLITVRGTLGGTGVVLPKMAGWNVSREVAVVPVLPARCVPSYFALATASQPCQNWLQERAKGVAYTGINIEDLRQLPVPTAPISEQHEIARRVDALFAIADRIETRLAAATVRADKLTQAILAKAFRGDLVPTEAELARRERRGYEPASVLLERIRAERDQPELTLASRKRSKGRAAK